MQAKELARRYALALLSAAGTEAEAAAAVLRDLDFAAEVCARDPEWSAVLSDPIRPAAERVEHARAVFEPHLGKLALSLLFAVIRKRRLPLLKEIVDAAGHMLDERLGVLRVRMVSARPIFEDRRLSLERRISERMRGRQVRLDVDVDASLLGGCVIHLGATSIDGSCRGRLEAIREHITRD